jgi:hypothetical protein
MPRFVAVFEGDSTGNFAIFYDRVHETFGVWRGRPAEKVRFLGLVIVPRVRSAVDAAEACLAWLNGLRCYPSSRRRLCRLPEGIRFYYQHAKLPTANGEPRV